MWGDHATDKGDKASRVDETKNAEQSALDPLLRMCLICPVTRKPLRLDTQKGLLISDSAGLAYPIRHGIPLMVATLAEPLEILDS